MKILLSLLLLLFVPLQACDTHHFLEKLASLEPSEWEEMKEKVDLELLNDLSKKIVQEDDLEAIQLLGRACRNFDALSDKKANPVTSYYKHYLPPKFLIPKIDLTLDVAEDSVTVTTQLFVEHNSSDPHLVLDGRGHTVQSVLVNDKIVPKSGYRVTKHELIIFDVPQDAFTVTIASQIDPFHNKSLEGLYATGNALITQCESEGARKIFYTLDRPDVLSRITTTIIADATRYRYRLSNGNPIFEAEIADGRTKIVWEDPIVKPSYLFACVLGNFDKIEDHFITKSGKNVTLEVYVEPQKASRGYYSLYALKKAMQFDEDFFDREYDLECLKMVAATDFNSGAMENKGLMIFNDLSLLVDEHTGTDSQFRRVAHTVAHEYFHNWSGNRVTVRNWFELALKEAFTDFRAMLFSEWLFGSDYVRPGDVAHLKEDQFPEETSEGCHPIMVESYVNARSIYDNTTYIKGREVFRALKTFMDTKVVDGFRAAQNLYFSRYDGQAVTFRELLDACGDVLQDGDALSQFELWFTEAGTPEVTVEVVPGKIIVTQHSPKPFVLPFSYEFLHRDGSIAHPLVSCVLTKQKEEFITPLLEDAIPLFMHGYPCPIILHYTYSAEELAAIMLHTDDAYCRVEASQDYALLAMQSDDIASYLAPYKSALENPKLSPLAKAQILQFPSLRTMAQKYNMYDYIALKAQKRAFLIALREYCRDSFIKLLDDYPAPSNYQPEAVDMHVRELRKLLLTHIGSKDRLFAAYYDAKDFDTTYASLRTILNLNLPNKEEISQDFYERFKDDKTLFTFWLSSHAYSSNCTVDDIKSLMQTPGFNPKNPNQIRASLGAFLYNLAQYHDPDGRGYALAIDQILEIETFNPLLAHRLAKNALMDCEKLPKHQQALMLEAAKRLLSPQVSPETRALVQKLIYALPLSL